jgi:site-specific DNA-methyltransferase (adenine-specific)
MIDLRNEDCGQTLSTLLNASVDLFLEDMPYGTTQLHWDKKHPNLEAYWQSRNRVAKPNAVYILFCDEPFTSFLIMSNLENFRQKLTWDKITAGGFLNSHKMFLDRTEDILVFSNAKNGNYTFNVQKEPKAKSKIRPISKRGVQEKKVFGKHNGKYSADYDNTKSLCSNILEFNSTDKECNPMYRSHPTQKPIDLVRFLVKVYSNENDTVFDGYSGSGTTAHACAMENRNFIGSELDTTYYENSIQRIAQYQQQPKLIL